MKLTSFLKKFGTDDACREHFESVRWPDGPVCTKCGSVNNAGRIASRPGVWYCKDCQHQFTATVGTALEGTRLPMSTWYLTMYFMLSTAKPISAMSLSRHLEIQYRTCWHMLHRLRAMLAGGERLPLSGIVEADETYVGGKSTNKRLGAPKSKRGRGTNKAMMLAAVERDGKARVAGIPSASAAAIDPFLYEWVGLDSTLMTDELGSYRWFGRKTKRHIRVNHSRREYVREENGIKGHVNTVEGFFGLFKRGVFGIHHFVSPKHLHRYAVEHEFRYNHRDVPVEERIARCLIGQHGRLRLSELLS
jgi:transposase-like protein